MKKTQIVGLAAFTLLGSLTTSHAQVEAASVPVGYTAVTCLANSDTIVSVPFLNTTDSLSSTVSGSIIAAGTSPDNTASFTMAGVTGITENQYQGLYYVRFTSGTLDGNVYQIDSNAATVGANTDVTIHLNGDNAADISASDSFKVYRFHTLASLFPQGNSTIVESLGNLAFQQRTQVRLPNKVSTGIDIALDGNYYQTSTGWKSNESGFPNADNVIIWPDSYFVIRHLSSVTSSTTYIATGSVDNLSNFQIPLSTNTSGKQDNFVAIPRPIDVTLDELNLYSADGPFEKSLGNLAFQRRDELLVFSNSDIGQDKAPKTTYFHDGTNWRKSASGFPIANNDIIKSTEGFIIRKHQTVDGATVMWNNTPSY